MTDQARFEAALQRANHVVYLLKTLRDQLTVLQAMEVDATRDLEAARDVLLEAQSSHMDPHPRPTP